MQESTLTPHSNFGQNKTLNDDKGFCFTNADVYNNKSSQAPKIFKSPKFVASRFPSKTKIDADMFSQKKDQQKYIVESKINTKKFEVIEENPYVIDGVSERESNLSVDLDQDQMVFIDVQNANSQNIFRQRKQTPNYTEHNIGPRFTGDGKVIKRSILGKPDAFLKMQNILFKNTSETMMVLKDRKTSIMGPKVSSNAVKDRPVQINKSYTSLNSMSSFDEGGEVKKKKPQSTISAKKPETDAGGKFHFMIRIGKDELIQDIENAEKRQATNILNDKELLQKLPPQDKRFFTKEQRIIEQYNKTQDLWKKKTKAVANKAQRKLETCVMAKTDEYRLKLEAAQTLDLLKNDDEKYGNQYWYLTLRDYPEGERPETQTLFKKSRKNFNSNNLEIVRKNIDDKNRKSPRRIMTAYGENEYLEKKIEENKKKMQVILPIDDDNFFDMQVYL